MFVNYFKLIIGGKTYRSYGTKMQIWAYHATNISLMNMLRINTLIYAKKMQREVSE